MRSQLMIEVSHPDVIGLDVPQLRSHIEILINNLIPEWLQFWEFSVWIVTDGEIRSLNRTRRGIDSATDVLSFPLIDLLHPLPIQILGEVVISWDTTMRQALEIGNTVRDEFYRLLVHGVLHIFGYDHETSLVDEIKMKEKEEELLILLLGEGDWV
jgi:probable rRNA maturation factor